ncbi:hypothetical protein PHYPO_G00234950 [Pangasianodon hypophthalmus]|uniref:Uncharacterized protein n=1 Tax=Pangasianodon hypophthalmus TaxID=310915 RepID=A0A5N5NK21_PANHP|nr:hypothetical protein PHYPO_G00234950 [Pangasianodon hypophthalmus]
MTPVPLASLNRMPVAPRMPLTGQTPYSFPTPSPVSVTTSATANDQVAITTEQDAPIYLGKSPVSSTGIGTSAVQSTLTTTMPTQVAAPANTSQSQEQPLNLSQPHLQTQGPSQPPVQLYRPTHSQLPQPSVSKQPPPPTQSTAATASTLGGLPQEKEIEEERLHRQQEKLLQLERERIELEKFEAAAATGGA